MLIAQAAEALAITSVQTDYRFSQRSFNVG